MSDDTGTTSFAYHPVDGSEAKTLTAPNGLTATLETHAAAADLRLKEIKHTLTGNVALSKHVYGYKPAGNIKSWAETNGSNAAKTWAIAYDKADQLEAFTHTQGTTVTAQQAFRFDRIGNITGWQDYLVSGVRISTFPHDTSCPRRRRFRSRLPATRSCLSGRVLHCDIFPSSGPEAKGFSNWMLRMRASSATRKRRRQPKPGHSAMC